MKLDLDALQALAKAARSNEMSFLKDAFTAVPALVERIRELEAENARLAKMELALAKIAANAKRTSIYENGALHDLVAPYLIDEARAALGRQS